MANNKLKPIPIFQLLGKEFFIPSYQRGYRWSTTQVTQLLDDIWEFSTKKSKTEKEFYCLQPIVVKAIKDDKTNNRWEVIDGQQRLTTIRIFLSYLVNVRLKHSLKEAFNQDEFSIVYETRPDSEDFLKNLNENQSNTCIDFYYMWQAYQATDKWFKNKDITLCFKFLTTLLTESNSNNPVKVIWYEIDEDINDDSVNDSIDIFTRLNMGKIPLTNAELIKALFLGKANKNNQQGIFKQLQIATEWDVIENTLQDESFWNFIYDKDNKNLPHHKYDTRIEYIFDLKKEKKDEEEQYFTFYKFFNEDFTDAKDSDFIPDIDSIWLKIKKYFLTFQEWYNDRELYHLIGFIIATGGDIKKLKEESTKRTKTSFKAYIIGSISKTFRDRKGNSIDIKELEYKNDKDLIKIILLLTNIQTLLENPHSKSYFPFDSYKKDKWDIEHVRSISEVSLIGTDRIEWAKLVLEFYTGIYYDKVKNEEYSELIEKLAVVDKNICVRLIELINDKTNDDTFFDNLYKDTSIAFKEDTIPDTHNISNLVLLDAGTNRSYQNAFFPIKRMTIMNKDMKGSFIPICTKNVFMKAYSKRFDKIMYWDETDAKDYMSAIESILKVYLT